MCTPKVSYVRLEMIPLPKIVCKLKETYIYTKAAKYPLIYAYSKIFTLSPDNSAQCKPKKENKKQPKIPNM